MNWFAVVRRGSGDLVSVGTVLADPMPDELEAIALEGDPRGKVWNAATRSFEDAPVEAVSLDPRDFFHRFTTAERVGMRTSGDPIVEDLMDSVKMARSVGLTDPRTVQGLAYLVAKGLLTSERRDEILRAPA